MWWDAMQELEDEHPGLVTGSVELLRLLRGASNRFGSSMIDYRYARRAERLADQLDAAGLLAAAERLAGMFTILRTALEHACVDQLLFNATKRRTRYTDADEEWERRTRAAVAAGAAGTEDIESVTRQGNDVVVVRGAHRLVNSEGQLVGSVSPYFVAMEHHSPFVGKKSDQADRLDVISTLEEKRSYAERNRSWWDEFLSWRAVKDNLVLNGFYTDRDVRRLDVHYAFLSAFTHAHNDGYQIVDHSRGQSSCHFCRELALLYIATIAAIEVRSILQHCVGKLDDEQSAQHESTLQVVDAASSHLWFPPGAPSEWDRHQVVLQRQAESRQFSTRLFEPEQLSDDEIPYYSNPMKRLVSLHQTTTEMVTNLTYRSPWPHPPMFHP